MNRQISISVIVPCYNQGEFLEECINSILKQTFQNWECIIINDGSTDNTHEKALDFSKKDDRIKYILQPNSGVCVARNVGLKNAKGEFILPLDADDAISDNYFEIAYKELSEKSSLKVVFGVLHSFGRINKIEDDNLPNFDLENQFFWNQIPSTSLFRRVDALSIGGYDEAMKYGHEDWEFYLRLVNQSQQVLRIRTITLYYRINEISRYTRIMDNKEKNLMMKNLIVAKNIGAYTAANIDLISSIAIVRQIEFCPEAHYSYKFILKLTWFKIQRTFKLLLKTNR
jgi:glycosyltransferase involved in cell wall biosynthesis